MHFIYVMSEQDKDKMLALGYVFVQEDKRNHMWVFQNKDTETFSCGYEMSEVGIHKFVLSNTLTF